MGTPINAEQVTAAIAAAMADHKEKLRELLNEADKKSETMVQRADLLKLQAENLHERTLALDAQVIAFNTKANGQDKKLDGALIEITAKQEEIRVFQQVGMSHSIDTAQRFLGENDTLAKNTEARIQQAEGAFQLYVSQVKAEFVTLRETSGHGGGGGAPREPRE